MEIWKPVVGYEGLYEVSSEGRVKSVFRTVPSKKGGSRTVPEKIKSFAEVNGYFVCPLYRNNKERRFMVHRLVAEAFIPNPEQKAEVNHIDGDKHNNRVSNLEWVTRLENVHHAIETGLAVQYDRHGNRNPMYGKHHSEAAKKAISAVHKGTTHSAEAKAKMSASHKGKKFSDAHKKALSESLKKAKTGLCWVTDGTISKMVSPKDAEELISLGWRRGRVSKTTKQE